MNTDPRTLIDDLLAYALRFAESNDEPATGDCWAVIERARHYLRESADQDQPRETAPSAPASGAVPGIPSLEALCAGGPDHRRVHPGLRGARRRSLRLGGPRGYRGG